MTCKMPTNLFGYLKQTVPVVHMGDAFGITLANVHHFQLAGPVKKVDHIYIKLIIDNMYFKL